MLLLLITMISCYKNSNGIFDISHSDDYSYTGYDSTGVVIVRGWLTLNLSDTTHVTGEWHFNEIDNPRGIGPQTGEGELTGGFNNEQLWINLNPDYRDNNVFLSGVLNEDEYNGTWVYSTFTGPTNQGIFKAKRQ